jgi:hypothetical protein
MLETTNDQAIRDQLHVGNTEARSQLVLTAAAIRRSHSIAHCLEVPR